MNALHCESCGQEFPKSSEHPMRELERNYSKIRKALVDIVGSDKKDELEMIEANIRLFTMAEEDRAHTINAIHALRDTIV